MLLDLEQDTQVFHIFSVGEISMLLKDTVEQGFSNVKVKGEVSALKRAESGHLYFSLKDTTAVINAICWRDTSSRLNFKLEDGMEIVISGKLSTYPGRSVYQLIAREIQIEGEGALLRELEKRKKALEKEGLFSTQHKKPIKKFPSSIGVVTSASGAVIRDIIHRIKARFPIKIILWPASVQGENAVGEIVEGIRGLNRVVKPDTIIVARGGGSIEDLWAFNEEAVVRAIFESEIPVISAIGHETDTTLADYVADVRAPTPTAAAELAVPVKAEILDKVNVMGIRITRNISNVYSNNKARYKYLIQKFTSTYQLLFSDFLVRCEKYQYRLDSSLLNCISLKKMGYSYLKKRHDVVLLSKYHGKLLDRFNEIKDRFMFVVKSVVSGKKEKLDVLIRVLESYSYQNVLKRGYSIVKTSSGIAKSIGDISDKKDIVLEMHDGSLKLNINTQENLEK